VLDLFKYAQDGGAEKDYVAFLEAIKLPLGDRIAREALNRNPHDFDMAAAGLRQSLTNQDDIPSVLLVFVWLRDWGPFAQAVEDWTQGDQIIADIISSAQQFHRLQTSGTVTAAARHQFLATVDALNTRLDT